MNDAIILTLYYRFVPDVDMDVFLPKPANTKILSTLFELKQQGFDTVEICKQLHAEFEECRITKGAPPS